VDTTTGRTGNEIARVSFMQPRSALKALSALEELGIVHRQRGGRDHIFTLNRNHFLVRNVLSSLYRSEKQFEEETFASLAKILNGKVVSTVVFGSTARHEEAPTSDFDICCIVRSEKDKEAARLLIDEKSSRLNSEFGVKVAPIFFTISEMKSKKNTPLLKKILGDGKLIVGEKLENVIGG